MKLFSIPDSEHWNPQPDHYPSLYLIDVAWHEWNASPVPVFEPFSYTEPAIPLINTQDQISTALADPAQFHGEKTLAVIQNIVFAFPVAKMTLISAKRKNQLGDSLQNQLNIPEAIESIWFVYPPPPAGTVIMINVSLHDLNSVITDSHIGQQLVKLTKAGYVVIVAAGNKINEAQEYTPFPVDSVPLENNVVVVGGYSKHSDSRIHIANYVSPESNYGTGVTCYMRVPISLKLYSIDTVYGQSSAATAQITGIILLMQNYAYTNHRRFLTSAEVQDILGHNGKSIVMNNNGLSINSFTPTWSTLKAAIDAKLSLFADIASQPPIVLPTG